MEQGKQVILSNYRSSNSQTIEDRQVEAFDFGPDYEKSGVMISVTMSANNLK